MYRTLVAVLRKAKSSVCRGKRNGGVGSRMHNKASMWMNNGREETKNKNNKGTGGGICVNKRMSACANGGISAMKIKGRKLVDREKTIPKE